MTQSLIINGKEYIQSNVLSSRCGYTPDYIGKLAREEKILGTQIGRQWFIEPHSLQTYLLQAQVQKNINADELKRRRKIEHAIHQNNLETKGGSLSDELRAISQTAIVVLCGLLVGTLGFTLASEDIGLSEIALGATKSASFVVQSMLPFDRSGRGQYAAASVESGIIRNQQPVDPLVFARLPQFPPRENISTSTAEVTEAQFSDEIALVTGADGKQYIEPVFKSGRGTTTFLLVPVNAEQN